MPAAAPAYESSNAISTLVQLGDAESAMAGYDLEAALHKPRQQQPPPEPTYPSHPPTSAQYYQAQLLLQQQYGGGSGRHGRERRQQRGVARSQSGVSTSRRSRERSPPGSWAGDVEMGALIDGHGPHHQHQHRRRRDRRHLRRTSSLPSRTMSQGPASRSRSDRLGRHSSARGGSHQGGADWGAAAYRRSRSGGSMHSSSRLSKTRECSPVDGMPPVPIEDLPIPAAAAALPPRSPSSEFVPQHLYGQEGWEWMEVEVVGVREFISEPVPHPPPGTILLELTAENLRLHEHAAAVQHMRSLMASRRFPSPLNAHDRARRAAAAAAAMGAAAAPPPRARALLRRRESSGAGISAAALLGAARWRFTAEAAAGVALAALWCVLLLLAVDATGTGAAAAPAWAGAYVCAALGILASLALLLHLVQTRPEAPPAPYAKSYMRKLPVHHLRPRRPPYNLKLGTALETLRVATSAACLGMHGTALSYCAGSTNASWFLTSEHRSALCEHPAEPLLVPLVVIESVLLAASLVLGGTTMLALKAALERRAIVADPLAVPQ